MENNVVKENFLEIIKSREITKTAEPNVLPMVIEDKSTLLPIIIPDISITEVKREYNTLKENKTLSSLMRFIKCLIKFLAKTVRFFYISMSNIVILACMAVIIVTSIAIVTKNVVNSYYNIEQPEDYTYSIFEMKEE